MLWARRPTSAERRQAWLGWSDIQCKSSLAASVGRLWRVSRDDGKALEAKEPFILLAAKVRFCFV